MSTTTKKIMSITHADFERSLVALDPTARLDANGGARVATPDGTVLLRFDALANRRLGGLLSMPQASITLDLGNLPENARDKFLKRFDIAFQRGGG
jgi:hypothetical protein